MASGLSCPARPLCPALSLSHPLIGMSRSINPSARPTLQINQQNMQNQNIIKDFIRVEHLHALWNNYVPEWIRWEVLINKWIRTSKCIYKVLENVTAISFFLFG